jgi:hypothetical protein
MTVFAEPFDFKGLYFREPDAELRALGAGPCLALTALDRGDAGLDELRTMFETLTQRGVHVPTAFYLDNDANGNVIDGPHKTWEQLLNDISNDYFFLWVIVSTMLNPDMRILDTVCCG